MMIRGLALCLQKWGFAVINPCLQLNPSTSPEEKQAAASDLSALRFAFSHLALHIVHLILIRCHRGMHFILIIDVFSIPLLPATHTFGKYTYCRLTAFSPIMLITLVAICNF